MQHKTKTADEIAAEIEKSYRANRALIKKAMKGMEPGGTSYLNHILALQKLDTAYRKERADRNLDPPDLSSATKRHFQFTATVAADGTMSVEESKEDAEIRKRLDEEYNT